MRLLLLLLPFTAVIFCADFDIQKLTEIFTGLNKEEVMKLDSIVSQKIQDKAKFEQVLKENNLYEKKMKLDQNLFKIKQEQPDAYNFVETVLKYSNGVRAGAYTEDQASEKVGEVWRSLRRFSKSYLASKYRDLMMQFFLWI